jgi:plastocyanin
LSLALPSAAFSATKTVDMGLPAKSAKTFNDLGVDVNDFFPHSVTIHAGDTVKFVPTSFHNVDLPARGKKPAPFLVGAGAVSGAADAAGAPFWFNGQTTFQFNPVALVSAFGKHLTYTGAKPIQSGAPLENKPKPMTVKFTKAGTYTYYCDIHTGMKGTVRVLAKGKTIPTAKQDAAALKKQVSRDLGVARTILNTNQEANSVYVGVGGPYGVEFFGFLPDNLSVKAGTTVKFQMSARSLEVHTATTGPGDPDKDPNSYLGALAAGFASPAPIDGRGVFSSEAPGSVASLSPALHGNGFWNTGVLDTDKASPLPDSGSVTFAAAGTYQFYCLVHAFMHGTVVVTA